ncbi:MAG TPA: sensor histidine kinase [Myxococcales bacterium]|jgi:signal transduction histidine kinase
MPARALERTFSRRMLPLAALCALVVAAAPPLAYWAVARQKLEAQALSHAAGLAAAMRGLVARQPTLWRFDADKVWQAAAPHRGQADVGEVRLTDCEGRTLLAGDGPGRGAGGGPVGWAPILSGGEAVAFVAVRMDPSAERGAALLIALFSGLLGLAMGVVLFRFPTRVVREQAGELSGSMARLRGAEQALTESNRELAARARHLSERVVGIQEEERRRIARDLHDSVGQTLTALQLELALARKETAAPGLHLDDALRCSEEAVGEVRRVVHDLRPPELSTAKLAEILRAYAERFEVRTGTAASFRAVGDAEPSEEVATCLLRVLQEALTNVARHASAKEVGILLELGAEQALLEISDDGRGFDAAAPKAGNGLRGIRERCAFLGGTVEVVSQPDDGTRLLVKLPLRGRSQP